MNTSRTARRRRNIHYNGTISKYRRIRRLISDDRKLPVCMGHHEKNNYTPLIVIVSLIVLAAIVTGAPSGLRDVLLHSMTGFFLVFGGFKLLDLRGFVDGYATYDLLAKRVRGYGYLYPFIELAFGFSMLAGYHPDWLLLLEAAVMLFGGIGVLLGMRKPGGIRCACLGTMLKVPLTSVSLAENFTMTIIALVLVAW